MGLTQGIDRKAYGLEADAMTGDQLMETFEKVVSPYLELGIDEVRRRRHKRWIARLVKQMILKKLGLG